MNKRKGFFLFGITSGGGAGGFTSTRGMAEEEKNFLQQKNRCEQQRDKDEREVVAQVGNIPLHYIVFLHNISSSCCGQPIVGSFFFYLTCIAISSSNISVSFCCCRIVGLRLMDASLESFILYRKLCDFYLTGHQ